MDDFVPYHAYFKPGLLRGKYRYFNLILILCIFFGARCYAQTIYFNKLIDLGATWGAGKSVCLNDSGYIISSVVGGGPGIGIIRLDSYGNRLSYNKISFPGFALYDGWDGSMKPTWDGGYIIGGSKSGVDSTWGLSIRLNHEGDSVYTRIYTPLSSPELILYSSNQTYDSGFIFTGIYPQTPTAHGDVIILKSDSVGNEIWRSSFGWSSADYGTSIIQAPDSGFIIGGYTYTPGLDDSGNPLIVKFDKYGDFTWNLQPGGPFDDQNAMVRNIDGSCFAALTIYSDSSVTSDYEYGRIRVVKYTYDGSIVWDRKFGPRKLGNVPGNILALSDGSLVCCGSGVDSTGYNFHGWVLKINSCGDSVWYRDHAYYWNNFALNFLYDISSTIDSGFIACGQAWAEAPNNLQKIWILKLDSLGCDTAGCDPSVGIAEDPFIAGSDDVPPKLEIWPNPARDRVRIAMTSHQRSEAESASGGSSDVNRQSKDDITLYFYDIWGRKVLEMPWPEGTERLELDVGKLPDGIYLCALYMGREQWLSGKLMVAHFAN